MTSEYSIQTSNLSIVRQDPALVEYSVSSNPRVRSTSLKIFEWLINLIKVITVCLISYWLLVMNKQSRQEMLHKIFSKDIADYDILFSIAFSALTLTFVLRRAYIEESFLVVSSFGVQVSSTGWWYIFGPVCQFIPRSDVLDILIHEAFLGFEVRYILVVVVKNQNRLQLVFGNILPKRDVLETVLRGSRECFYKCGEENYI